MPTSVKDASADQFSLKRDVIALAIFSAAGLLIAVIGAWLAPLSADAFGP